LGWKEAFFGKGNFIRFVIAFVIFLLQQWSGQNSVGYYAPQIFASIGYTGKRNSLLASGVYGIIKLVATTIFIFFGVETLGRRWSLFISALGMGTLFFIIGAILKTHPPPATNSSGAGAGSSPNSASQGMAAMLYIYVVFYSMGWGPLPWVYVSDIFPTRTRHYGMALASASQWLWSEYQVFSPGHQRGANEYERLCRVQGYAVDDYRPRFQDLYDVCRRQHWRDVCFLFVSDSSCSEIFHGPPVIQNYPGDKRSQFGRHGYYFRFCYS